MNNTASNSTHWFATRLRLTAFVDPTKRPTSLGWFQDLTGEQPEQQTSSPKSGEFTEEGHYLEGKLSLSSGLNRIDWHYFAEEIPDIDKINVLGTFEEATQIFEQLMLKWLDFDAIPPINRLAFGAYLVWPVSNNAEAYTILPEFLPVEFDPDNTSDFIYRINRRRYSNVVDSMLINRLHKWSVVRRILAKFQIQGSNISADITDNEGRIAVDLELDMNTYQEFDGYVESNHLAPLFSELVRLAQEISEHGDIE